MTKEELHNHIKDVAEYYVSKSWNSFLDLDTTDLILAGIGVGKIIASEQEKEIATLGERCLQLQKDKGNLTDKVKELEVQIEKMKCGGNCKHLYHVNTGGCYDAKCDLTYCDCTNCKDEWEFGN